MKKIVFASTALILCTLGSYAQIGFGVEAGVNASDYTVKKGGNTAATDFRYGARFGLLSDLALSDNFYFQPGVYYLSGGYKMKVTGADVETIIHTIQIPLNVQYKIGVLGSNRLFVGAGPYISWNKDGTFHVVATGIDSRSDLKIGSTVSDQMKSIDLGLGANVGYQITEGLFVRMRYQKGFTQLDPGGVSGNTARSSGFCLSVGYLFYRKNNNGTIKIDRDRTKKK
jgi:hypothetical protein